MYSFSCWILENRQDTFRYLSEEKEEYEVNAIRKHVRNFRKFESLQKVYQMSVPEIRYDQSKSPYLYSWFVTDKAMVMLLSDGTFQVNAKVYPNNCLLAECLPTFLDQFFGKSSKDTDLPASRNHNLHQQIHHSQELEDGCVHIHGQFSIHHAKFFGI